MIDCINYLTKFAAFYSTLLRLSIVALEVSFY